MKYEHLEKWDNLRYEKKNEEVWTGWLLIYLMYRFGVSEGIHV